MHNRILDMVGEQISYDLSRSFHAAGSSNSSNDPKSVSEILRSNSLALGHSALGGKGHKDDDVGGSALHGYFHFIDFVQLQVSFIHLDYIIFHQHFVMLNALLYFEGGIRAV